MISIMETKTKGGGSSRRDGVALPHFDNTPVFSIAIIQSTSVLLLDVYATGGRATPSRIVFLSQKQNNRFVAAAVVASYRPPANASSLAGTLRYATPAGACYSTPPPTTQNESLWDPAMCSPCTLIKCKKVGIEVGK